MDNIFVVSKISLKGIGCIGNSVLMQNLYLYSYSVCMFYGRLDESLLDCFLIVGWMSQHNSTLTSSPTKESASPDINIHPGQGLLLQIPGSLATPSNTRFKGHNLSDLSTGPLDMLDR